MATEAQITANRLNAQKSTGPRSAEGRAVSRFNALKHAATAKSLVIPGEDENALAELTASYEDSYQPVGPEEELLVEKIVTADWTQRRMRRIHADVLKALIAQQEASNDNPTGNAVIQDSAGSNVLQKIFRCREAASREWYRARKELRLLQSQRIALDPPAPVQPIRPESDPQPEPITEPPSNPPSSASLQQPSPTAQSCSAAPVAPRGPGKLGSFFDENTPKAWRL